MTDVYDRVQAVFEMSQDLLKASGPLHPETNFATDAALVNFRTYDILRNHMKMGMTNLKIAADMSKTPLHSHFGTHLVVLRPALVSFSKALWMLAESESKIRIERAAGLVLADRAQGHRAMGNASRAHPNEGFQAIGEFFERAQTSMESELARVNFTPARPPADGTLVENLGAAIDIYYGSAGSARQDALILWNASSSLSHGERWFSQLYTHLARAFTERSLDVVCSGFNLVHLHTLQELADTNALVRFPSVAP
ncbi:hypothetical protein [Pseudarthrobacter oxydans]|uniref:hypothetical protein n=1 Tax=Pseudarthrobacter oxydans TaxID=1671 RepID=UPI0037FBB52C